MMVSSPRMGRYMAKLLVILSVDICNCLRLCASNTLIMLSIKKYAKYYSGTLVLSVDDLVLSQGIHWIKGENGSGKSTLLKSIAGIIPFEGEIAFGDICLKKHGVQYRRLVNYSEAEPLFPGFLTAKDLVRFIGKTKGATRGQQDFYTEAFNVHPFFEKPCEAHSSGMTKKLSLALAFLGNPGVIILDEPLITLDEHTRKILSAQITASANNGTTFLVSSHQALDDFHVPLSNMFAIREKTLLHD
jgi:ABC-2 type transport system ATP-binding protein